jgi:osmotically inducible lipoprotein OsmB
MKLRIFASVVCAMAFVSSLSACASRETVGTVGGAALGGVAGHELSGGNTAATVGGAAVGGVIGNKVSK